MYCTCTGDHESSLLVMGVYALASCDPSIERAIRALLKRSVHASVKYQLFQDPFTVTVGLNSICHFKTTSESCSSSSPFVSKLLSIRCNIPPPFQHVMTNRILWSVSAHVLVFPKYIEGRCPCFRVDRVECSARIAFAALEFALPV